MGFFQFLLVLLFIVLPIVALGLQTIPRKLEKVTFRDTDPAHAWLLVAQYAEGTFEQRFGYPTGYFSVDEKRSVKPRRILIREAQPSGAVTDGCSMALGQASMSGFEAGCGPGCFGLVAIGMLGAPFFLISILDRFFRLILRSRVDVNLNAMDSDTVASFAFYGPGGYSLLRRYAQVFHKPVLPVEVAAEITSAPAHAEAEAAERSGTMPPEGSPA